MNSQCIFINLPGKWQQEEQLIRCIFREPAIKQCGHKKFQHILLQNSQKPFQNVALNSTSQKDYSFPFVKCMSCESLTSKTVILKARCTNPMKIHIHNWNALKKKSVGHVHMTRNTAFYISSVTFLQFTNCFQ